MTWRTFVQAHWPALVAADFFTTEVWIVRGLVTYYTAFATRADPFQIPQTIFKPP